MRIYTSNVRAHLAAGVARLLATVLADLAVLRDLRKATLLRGQRNFDNICKEADSNCREPNLAINSENIVD